MLLELAIRDLALIEQTSVAFGPGLNVITGETGAGKSLLVGALELLVGERPRGRPEDVVRAGAESALVEGRFELGRGAQPERVRAWLAEHLPALVEAGPPEEIVLSRSIARDGRSRAHVDQRPVPQRDLRALAGLLIEIHGQHEHQSLFDPSEQRALIDRAGATGDALARYRAAREAWRALALAALERSRRGAEREQRLELARWQLGELQAARLVPGERAALGEERELLRSAQEIARELGGQLELLRESDGSALERLAQAERVLGRWAARVAALGPALEQAAAARAATEEVALALARVVERAEHDPARLERVEQRLELLERLERRHGARGDALVECRAALERELAELEGGAGAEGERAAALAAARSALDREALALARERANAGRRLCAAVQRALAALGLARARLEVAAGLPALPEDDLDEALVAFAPDGLGALELHLAANPGEGLRPLAAVASGGEAARILLAIQSVLAAGHPGRSLVFDEIDSGVGGRLGPEVARVLAGLSAERQVLCVTHIPAIAAAADRHLRASKELASGRTRTRVETLEGDARVAELAAMIGGQAEAPGARAEARRLLKPV